MKLVERVQDFLSEKSKEIASEFYSNIITRIEEWEELDKTIESPVEQLFYIEWQFRKFYDRDLLLELEPQYKDKSTGKYRLDFLFEFIQEAYLLNSGIGWDDVVMQVDTPKLGIEIDGYIWHERTKEQVQYHKERERFLVSNGWKLLRFTGSEVYKNPGKCVDEILEIADPIREKYHNKLYSLYKKNKEKTVA